MRLSRISASRLILLLLVVLAIPSIACFGKSAPSNTVTAQGDWSGTKIDIGEGHQVFATPSNNQACGATTEARLGVTPTKWYAEGKGNDKLTQANAKLAKVKVSDIGVVPSRLNFPCGGHEDEEVWVQVHKG